MHTTIGTQQVVRPHPRLRHVVPALLLALVTSLGLWSGPAAAAIPGLQVVSKTSLSNSVTKAVWVYCPSGKKVIGTGAEIIDGSGNVVIDDVIDDVIPGDNYVQARAVDVNQNGNWAIKVYAICADPLPGWQRVRASTPISSTNPQNISIACPTGKKVIGTGFERGGAQGKVTVDDLVPNAALTAVFLTAYELGPFGTLDTWNVTVFAICADPLPDLARVSSTSPSDLASSKSRVASCPAPKKVTGGGFELAATAGYGVINNFLPPNSPPTQIKATASKRPGDPRPQPWSITSYAICASP